MKRFAKFLPAALLLLLAAAVLLLDLPSWQPLDLAKITSAGSRTVLYDSSGAELSGLYSGAEHIWASLEEMPEYLPQAFIAAEDARFYSHPGVDVRRIFGALLSNLRTLRFSEGASTITQQLVRMTHLSAEKTISRKAQEAVLALRLEKQLSKNEILEYYLNTAYFGSGAYGVGSAAHAYFSKTVSELTLSEAALLAGLVKAPSAYEPDKNPEKALARRAYVLSAMLKNGFLTQQQHDQAQAEPLALHMPARETASFGWYIDAVLEEAVSTLDISAEAFLTGGYRVFTALDPAMQAEADALFADPVRFPDPAADGTPAQAALAAVE
ncbi:MAG: transglycosylase domain-containing protein, partial [Clostridia bacterium]|nr:transglycosylase domain-containing protein [Clostridia bacterium]